MTLTEFLEARIAEDEAAARKASEMDSSGNIARWRDAPGRDTGQSIVWNGTGQAVVSHAYHHQGVHIARHDPARVLADCEAKRRILEQYQEVALRPGIAGHATMQGFTAALEGVLADLALPYASHPEFREEWAL